MISYGVNTLSVSIATLAALLLHELDALMVAEPSTMATAHAERAREYARLLLYMGTPEPAVIARDRDPID